MSVKPSQRVDLKTAFEKSNIGKELVLQAPAASPAAVSTQPIEFPLAEMLSTVVAANKSAQGALQQSNQLSQQHIEEQQRTIELLLAENAALKIKLADTESSSKKAGMIHRAEMKAEKTLDSSYISCLQAQIAYLQDQNADQLKLILSMKPVIENVLRQLDLKKTPAPTLSSIAWEAWSDDPEGLLKALKQSHDSEHLEKLQPRVDRSMRTLMVLMEKLKTFETQKK